MKLNAGCGTDIYDGYVNLDRVKIEGMVKTRDKVHDLNVFPYPFANNTFTEILCYATLEHLKDTDKIMREFHRILKPGGTLDIRTSHRHSNRAWLNPTQVHVFQSQSFDYYEKGNHIACQDYRFDFSFRIIKSNLKFGMWQPWNWIVSPLANAYPMLYECTFLGLFPCIELHVILQKPWEVK
jgi:ubiquinone/menaquinone biosynthesis C-methylase UbiE